MRGIQNSMRTITVIAKANFIRWNAHFFALSRLDAVDTNITFRNTGSNAVKRGTESHAEIFLAQNFRHSEAPRFPKNNGRLLCRHSVHGISILVQQDSVLMLELWQCHRLKKLAALVPFRNVHLKNRVAARKLQILKTRRSKDRKSTLSTNDSL